MALIVEIARQLDPTQRGGAFSRNKLHFLAIEGAEPVAGIPPSRSAVVTLRLRIFIVATVSFRVRQQNGWPD